MMKNTNNEIQSCSKKVLHTVAMIAGISTLALSVPLIIIGSCLVNDLNKANASDKKNRFVKD
jgi:hypothetical protein